MNNPAIPDPYSEGDPLDTQALAGHGFPLISLRSSPMLPAPRLLRQGPYLPGQEIGLHVDIANERPIDESNVRISFQSDDPSVAFDPQTHLLTCLPARRTERVESTIRLLPDIASSRVVQVWARVSGQTLGDYRTAPATLAVQAIARLSLTQEPTQEGMLRLSNDGHVSVSCRLFAEPLPVSGEIALFEGLSWVSSQRESTQFRLEPNEHRLIDARLFRGIITIKSDDGEQRSIRLTNDLVARGIMDLSCQIHSVSEGVRANELLSWAVVLTNKSSVPLDDVRIRFALPEGVAIDRRSITVNGAPILSNDFSVENGYGYLRSLRLYADEAMAISGHLVCTAEELDDSDTLTMHVTAESQHAPSVEAHATVPFDRRPPFSSKTTYFSAFERIGDRQVAATLYIANSSMVTYDHSALLLSLQGAVLLSARDVQPDGREQPLPLHPSMGREPLGRILLGTLQPNYRRTIRCIFKLLPAAGSAHQVSLSGYLTVGGFILMLEPLEQAFPGVAQLAKSRLDLPEGNVLQLGIPTVVQLSLHNTGSIRANDVRVRFDGLPEGVEVSLLGDAEGRWSRVVSHLPPDCPIGIPITFTPKMPLLQSSIRVQPFIDAEGHNECPLEPVEFSASHTSALSVSPFVVESAVGGLVRISVEITNVGDSVADDVVVYLPNDGNPVPQSLLVDGYAIANHPPYHEGVPIGSLPPRQFRHLVWVAAPPPQKYTPRISLQWHGCSELMVVRGTPTTRHLRGGLATELPPPRQVEYALPTDSAHPSIARSEMPDFSSDLLALPSEPRQPRVEPLADAPAEATPEPMALESPAAGAPAETEDAEVAAPADTPAQAEVSEPEDAPAWFAAPEDDAEPDVENEPSHPEIATLLGAFAAESPSEAASAPPSPRLAPEGGAKEEDAYALLRAHFAGRGFASSTPPAPVVEAAPEPEAVAEPDPLAEPEAFGQGEAEVAPVPMLVASDDLFGAFATALGVGERDDSAPAIYTPAVHRIALRLLHDYGVDESDESDSVRGALGVLVARPASLAYLSGPGMAYATAAEAIHDAIATFDGSFPIAMTPRDDASLPDAVYVAYLDDLLAFRGSDGTHYGYAQEIQDAYSTYRTLLRELDSESLRSFLELPRGEKTVSEETMNTLHAALLRLLGYFVSRDTAMRRGVALQYSL